MVEPAEFGNPVKGCTLCRRLEQLLKRYNRGEIARVEWLDHLTLTRIQQCRAQVPVPFHPMISASGQPCGMHKALLYAPRRQACIAMRKGDGIRQRECLHHATFLSGG